MSEILEHLFLSSIRYAKDLDFIKKNSITHVLLAAKTLKPSFPKILTYLQFPITDNPSTLILSFFPQAIQFIDSIVKSSKKELNILVHCLGGRSRSVTIVTSYVMYEKKLSCDQALEFVKKKHPFSFPNPGFIKQLRAFEICLDKYFIGQVIEELKNIGVEENKDEEEFKTSEEVKSDLKLIKNSYEILDVIVKKHIDKNFKKTN